MFDCMGALSTSYNESPKTASRAFDKTRDGFVIAGGGGIVILEELEHAKARGAKIYAELVGYAANSDGYDMVAPSGVGGQRCMDLAMANAVEALNEVTEEGFVSNNSQANGRKSWDRSQPPVGSMMCWEIYQKHPRKWFLEEVYPKLIRWNDWWMERRLELVTLWNRRRILDRH